MRSTVVSGKPQRSRPRVHAARRRFSSNELAQLVADYQAGRSTTWLMRSYKVGKGTVLGILEEQGVKMRGQGIPDDRLQEAIALYTSGLSLKQVAAQLVCSAETVRQALMAAGVSLRAPWQRGSG
jgi:hypothetical protein